jgi:hypothetical protein
MYRVIQSSTTIYKEVGGDIWSWKYNKNFRISNRFRVTKLHVDIDFIIITIFDFYMETIIFNIKCELIMLLAVKGIQNERKNVALSSIFNSPLSSTYLLVSTNYILASCCSMRDNKLSYTVYVQQYRYTILYFVSLHLSATV